MRIFKYRSFHRWAKDKILTDASLKEAIHEIKQGLFEANLGCGLYKKRIARKGEGKRGGYRILLAFKDADRTIFIYGFAKNVRDNIDELEKDLFKRLSRYYLTVTDTEINNLIKIGELIEVQNE